MQCGVGKAASSNDQPSLSLAAWGMLPLAHCGMTVPVPHWQGGDASNAAECRFRAAVD